MVPRETTTGIGFDRAMSAVFGHLAFELLWSGVELGVFELLAKQGPLPEDVLRGRLELQPTPARILFDGLAGMGVLEKEGTTYRCSDFALQALTRDGESSLVDVLAWQHHIVYPAAFHMAQSLKEDRAVGLEVFPEPGNSLYARLANVPKLEAIFQKAMAAMPSNRFLPGSLPLDGVRHLVDLGGGNGRNAIALAQLHPNLKVTVFDAPSVCERARANIAAHGLSDRVDTHPGDMFETPFPKGIDAILLSHIGSIWSEERNLSVFRRAREALPPGGRLLVYNMVADENGTGPLPAIFGSAYFHAIAGGRGMVWPASTYVRLFEEAGLQDVVHLPAPVDHAVIVGTSA